MEEREIVERVNKLFNETMPTLKNIYRGFVKERVDLLRDGRVKFRESLKKWLPGIERLVQDSEKNETVKRFVLVLPHLQRVALALDNLVVKMEIKVETNVPFTQKAFDDIRELMEVVGKEFNDVNDYFLTKNPMLKEQIRADMAKIGKMVDEFEIVHQQRLLAGVCMPKASYLYIDMIDSLKRMAHELAVFSVFADKA